MTSEITFLVKQNEQSEEFRKRLEQNAVLSQQKHDQALLQLQQKLEYALNDISREKQEHQSTRVELQ